MLDDISAPLGGEVTFAFDGPLLPTPSWKLVMEVYDPEKLQATISALVESFNRQAPANAGELQFTSQQVGSQQYFTLSNSKHSDSEVDYTFVDSYLIAAPNQALLARAIQNRQAGYTLFRSQLFPLAASQRRLHEFFGDSLSQPGRGIDSAGPAVEGVGHFDAGAAAIARYADRE